MRRLLRKLFDIHDGEGLRALLMFVYIFLVIASLLIVKPVRNSLFLSRFGIDRLPYVFLLVAVTAAVVTTVYARFARRFRLYYLIFGSTAISILCLIVFWLLLSGDYQQGWFIYAFYIWVAIFGVISTSQFWLLANYVFNAREAKRLFGFIGAGAISGGIFGGYLTNFLAPLVGTDNLLFFCIGFLTMCQIILGIVWKISARRHYGERILQQQRVKPEPHEDNPLKLILSSRHLTYLTGIIGLSVIVANLVDYQYSAIASAQISDSDELTAFFGRWLSNLSIVSLVIQFFLTGRVLKQFGVGLSLFFLPVGVLIGTVLVMINPALWSAIAVKVGDGSFKQSINKAGLELLYLPVPTQIKNQTKTFIDVFVDSLATGIGGLLLIVLTRLGGFSVPSISLVIVAHIGLWCYLIIKVRHEYIQSFRTALEKRSINLQEETVNVRDVTIYKSLVNVLEGSNDRQILYVLNMLDNVTHDRFIPYYRRLLDHPAGEVKARILSLLNQFHSVDITAHVREMVDHPDQAVQIEAINYLCQRTTNREELLLSFLNSPDIRIQSAAFIYAAAACRDDAQIVRSIDLVKLFEDRVKVFRSMSDPAGREELKINAATVIGILRTAKLFPYLHILLNDPSTRVLEAAIMSAGQTQGDEFIPILIKHLTTKMVRRAAREALARYHEKIIDTLVESLIDKNEDKNIRLAIPKVLSLIGSQKSANALSEHLEQNDLLIRYEIIKALHRLRVRFPMIKFNDRYVDEKIFVETRNYYRIILFLHREQVFFEHEERRTNAADASISAARHLLIKALEERLDVNLDRIFRLLGLKYRPADIGNAYNGIRSDKATLRANAIEFLDNILAPHLKRFILPIIESRSIEHLIRTGYELFQFEERDECDCLNALLDGNDNWLKSCALFLIAKMGDERYFATIGKILHHPDPIVRETAEYALQKINMNLS